MTAIDLLGDGPSRLIKGGYAAMPGTGPQGERCKGCSHFHRQIAGNANFFKCGIGKQSHGRATDIRANAKACRLFKAKP